MAFSFQCPACQATISGTNHLAGRRVRCPQCDSMVEAQATAGTVYLTPGDEAEGKTVLLEAVEVTEALGTAGVHGAPIEVTEVVEIDEIAPPPAEPPEPRRLVDEEDEPSPTRPKRRLDETQLDMTPMVDVTFLLLIFFMVTAAFALQKSIEVPKPSEDEPSENVVEPDPEQQRDSVTVQVDEYNTYHVITVDWEEEAPSEQDLHIMLGRARDGDSTGTVPTKLRVEAHGDSLHEKVVAALDAGTANGFEEVLLATIEDE